MERTNKLEVAGYIGFPKNIGETSVAQLSLPINRGTKEEPNWDYLNLRVAADKSKVDFTALEGKRVQIAGYISGEAYTPKDGIKEITVAKVIVSKAEELEKGAKSKNEITLTSMSKFVREFGEKGVGAQLSVSFNDGTKETPEYKYVNIGLTGSRSRLSLVDDEIITVKGFLKADFFVPKGAEKEINLPVIVGMEVLERETPGSSNNDQNDDAPAPEFKEEDNNVDIDSDEIPF